MSPTDKQSMASDSQVFTIESYDTVEEEIYPALFRELARLEGRQNEHFVVNVAKVETPQTVFEKLSYRMNICVLSSSDIVARVMMVLVRLHVNDDIKSVVALLGGNAEITINEVIERLSSHACDMHILSPAECSLHLMDVWTLTRLRIDLEAVFYRELIPVKRAAKKV